MSILSTVKKGYLYMKTSSGYLKLLPRTLASLVSLDNGNSVETEISNIKTAATNLSSTVSGHTTTLNSHGSSISAIKTKTDALKDAANKTVANNLTTTKDGYVLDARMGKSLQDSITTLNSTLGNKIIIGSNKDTVLIVTNQTINFSNGQGTVNVSDIAFAYSKTVRNAIVQLKSASSAVVTSATVSENKVAVKCSNLSGTAFAGNIATTVLLFMY